MGCRVKNNPLKSTTHPLENLGACPAHIQPRRLVAQRLWQLQLQGGQRHQPGASPLPQGNQLLDRLRIQLAIVATPRPARDSCPLVHPGGGGATSLVCAVVLFSNQPQIINPILQAKAQEGVRSRSEGLGVGGLAEERQPMPQ